MAVDRSTNSPVAVMLNGVFHRSEIDAQPSEVADVKDHFPNNSLRPGCCIVYRPEVRPNSLDITRGPEEVQGRLLQQRHRDGLRSEGESELLIV